MNIVYKIDGVDISTYGVYVSASDGLLGRPSLKKPTVFSWPEHHGEVVDLEGRMYEPRVITLDCFIVADSKDDFIAKCNIFLAIFDKNRTLRLHVAVDPTKPLVYEVYLDGGVGIRKVWSAGMMSGRFSIKLREPEPVKRVYSVTFGDNDDKKGVQMYVNSTKPLNIYFGDVNGTRMIDVVGDGSQKITHDYGANGTYYIVLTGDVDSITSITFKDNKGVLVWSKL